MERKDWPAKVYRNFETPDEDDRAYYRSLTPQQRLQIMIDLLPPEHREQRLDRTPRIVRRPGSDEERKIS